jgi:hypothetical protein
MLPEAIAVCAGLSLSAACGFRVFLPPLALAIAVRAGAVPAAAAPDWIGATPTLIVLGAATLCELLVYKVPWLDHAMDTVATPGAIAAGVAVCAAVLPPDVVPPAAKWAIAIVAGGGAAGAVQGGTVVARAASGATTGGLGNPLVAKAENLAAMVLSALAIVVPIAAAVVVLVVLGFFVRLVTRWRKRQAVE